VKRVILIPLGFAFGCFKLAGLAAYMGAYWCIEIERWVRGV
jgi:hypothetical protein